MRRLFTCAVALGIAAAMPALAEEHHEQGSQHGPAPAEHGPEGGGHPMAMSHAAPGAEEHHLAAPRETVAPHAMAEAHHYNGGEQHNSPRAAPAQAHDGEHHGSFNAPWHDSRASQHFHDGGYRAPEGYHPQHWRHGDHLPQAYYGRDYWIDNYVEFGLYAPPPDYVWVRVGDDAVLIDEDDGSVVEVEYGIFY